MIPTPARAIGAMVAPVVLITAGGIISNGILSVSGSVNDRLRAMNRERFELLSDDSGSGAMSAERGILARERMREIDVQVPMLIRRHNLLRNAVLSIYLSIGALVVAVVALGLSVTITSEVAGLLALAFVLAGSVGLLVALAIAARSTWLSHDAVDFETRAAMAMGTPER